MQVELTEILQLFIEWTIQNAQQHETVADLWAALELQWGDTEEDVIWSDSDLKSIHIDLEHLNLPLETRLTDLLGG